MNNFQDTLAKITFLNAAEKQLVLETYESNSPEVKQKMETFFNAQLQKQDRLQKQYADKLSSASQKYLSEVAKILQSS